MVSSVAETRPPGGTSRPGGSAPMVSFDKVTKRFGLSMALSDVSLELLTDNAIERAPSRAAENDGDIDQQHQQRKFIATFR